MGTCMSSGNKEKHEKKKLDQQVLHAEAKAEQLLAEMPGRVCSNAATKKCSLYSQPGAKGINQDSMLVWEGFAAEEESVFLGVFDGHGPNGQLVACKVRDCLPSLLTLPLESLLDGCDTPDHHIYKPIKITDPRDSVELDNDGATTKRTDEMQIFVDDVEDSSSIRERFTAAFHKMDERLKRHPKISCMSSGTTAVAILLQGKDLVLGNVGDSRAIIATRLIDGSLVANPLTTELKPDSPGERERILKCQGRIFALDNEPHIQRLWLPHVNTPGLAMARALGDFCLKEYGLIATPQTSHTKLSEEDEFIVLATDGVWDVLTNAEVIEAVCLSASKEEAAESIVKAATDAWKRKNLADRIDDCTVVCHFLKEKKPGTSCSVKVSHKLESKELKLTENDVNNDLKENACPPQQDRPLARYDTLVATDSRLELSSLKLDEQKETVSKHDTGTSEQAENHPARLL